jgi:hypothetical protein
MKNHGTQLSLFEAHGPSDAFAVRVSARARRLTARVHVGGRVEIVVPEGVTAKSVRDFVQRFTPWIDRKVAAMQCIVQATDPVPACIEFQATGERFEVDWHVGPRRALREQGRRLSLEAPNDRDARMLLRRWLRTARQSVDPLPAYALGELLDARHLEPQLLAAVSTGGGRTIPVRTRTRAFEVHESFAPVLGPGRKA